jgi:hypothetical protein
MNPILSFVKQIAKSQTSLPRKRRLPHRRWFADNFPSPAHNEISQWPICQLTTEQENSP